MPSIRAVTFDFSWTLYVPRESEQVARARADRPAVLRKILSDAGRSFTVATIRDAFRPPAELVGTAATLGDAVDGMCAQLGIEPSEGVRRRLVRALDELAGRIQWRRAAGAAAVLRHLRQRDYRLGLVANVHFPSSRVIRQALGADGTLMYFQAFAFSDEVGVYKPDPAIFGHVLYRLDMDTTPEAVIHVGDDPRADVAGAREAGMRTVRYAGFRDEPADPEADAVLYDFRELPDLIREFAN